MKEVIEMFKNDDVVLRVITADGELVSVENFPNEYVACEAMDDVFGEDLVVQVIMDDMIYAEKLL